MSNTNYAIDGTLGVNITDVTDEAGFGLGTRIVGNDGAVYLFCQANGAITGDGYVCLVDEAFQATLIDTTNSATGFGQSVGVAKAVFTDNQYGWVQTAGVGNVRVAASCAANVALNTTATAGVLDDDATVGSEVVNGLILTTAAGGAEESAAGYLNLSNVGATL